MYEYRAYFIEFRLNIKRTCVNIAPTLLSSVEVQRKKDEYRAYFIKLRQVSNEKEGGKKRKKLSKAEGLRITQARDPTLGPQVNMKKKGVKDVTSGESSKGSSYLSEYV